MQWRLSKGTLSSSEEFRRKVRIIAGGIQSLRLGEGIPRFGQPLLLFCYISHKLLRWLVPCFLLLLLLLSVAMIPHPLYQLFFYGQILFYSAAVCYALRIPALRRFRFGSIPYYFCLVNGAAFIGLWKGLLGTQTVTWQRTTRT